MSDSTATLVPESDEQAGKRLRKLERMLETRTLDPWERYRALTDVLDTYSELLEHADRKTRFALIIMGLLNAVNFLLVARSDVFGVATASIGTPVAIYVALYAFLSLYFFSQAIEALRPRSARFFRDEAAVVPASATSRRLRAVAHVAAQSPEEYLRVLEGRAGRSAVPRGGVRRAVDGVDQHGQIPRPGARLHRAGGNDRSHRPATHGARLHRAPPVRL